MKFLTVVALAFFATCISNATEINKGNSSLDNLNSPGTYSLEIAPGGKPAQGYFPMGMRPGMSKLTVHCGFNLWQPGVIHWKTKSGAPIPAYKPDGPSETPCGHFHYTQIKPLNSLWRGIPRVPGYVPQYGNFPPVITEDGKPRRFNTKDSVNYFVDPTWKFCRDYIDAFFKSQGNTPLAQPSIMWGMDNEVEGTLDYSPQARAAFAAWAKKFYDNDIIKANSHWKTSFKSFDDLLNTDKMPNCSSYKTQPAFYIAWRRFQVDNFIKLMSGMAKYIYEKDPYKRPVIYKSTQQTIEMPYVNRKRTFDHDKFHTAMGKAGGRFVGANIYGSGDRQAYETNYIYNIARPINPDKAYGYGAMTPETNNHSGPGFQWASTFWRVLPNGQRGVIFFCTGYKGATRDYDTFGHVDPTGKPRDKMFYAARWAHMVHRTEKLWSTAVPSMSIPKVAILLPSRDIILSDRTTRRKSKWVYPRNHRIMIYSWLRESGYWVDIIPYSKLKAPFLKHYQAVLLTGTEHLTKLESEAISDYVKSGGVVVADERPGEFDDWHRRTDSLDKLFGVKVKSFNPYGDTKLKAPLNQAKVYGNAQWEISSARVVQRDIAGKPVVTANKYGKGIAILLGFVLGDMRNNPNSKIEHSTFKAGKGQTADEGSDSKTKRTELIAHWLTNLLSDYNVKPSYQCKNVLHTENGIVRVEQPNYDQSGNAVFTIGNRGLREKEPIAPFTLEIPLPGGPWNYAVIGLAENDALKLLPVKYLKNGKYQLNIPAIKTVAVIYLMKKHAPLTSIEPLKTARRSIDGYGPVVLPGEKFNLRLTVLNPCNTTSKKGKLRLLVPDNWLVTPGTHQIPALKPYGTSEIVFHITVEPDSDKLVLNWLYPIVARLKQGEKDIAIAETNIEIAR